MSVTDPAARSIRIATTLCERFRAILTAPSTDSLDAMELRIGEAQQIYPEIWRHLDDARAALDARAADTAAYDTLRATQGPAKLGVTDVETFEQVGFDLGGFHHTAFKTATFNLEGYRTAYAACQALMRAMPEVDFKALERAEAAEIAAAGSLAPVSPAKLLRGALIAAALAGVVDGFWYLVIRQEPVDWRARDQQRAAERDARIEELRARLDIDPCEGGTLDTLFSELQWTPNGSRAARTAKRQYTEQCRLQRTGSGATVAP